MNCPTCNVSLVISERLNVEIDYCPQCRGVWLDRGELDKIIEKANRTTHSSRSDGDDGWRDSDRRDPYKKKKRESFIGELFDF